MGPQKQGGGGKALAWCPIFKPTNGEGVSRAISETWQGPGLCSQLTNLVGSLLLMTAGYFSSLPFFSFFKESSYFISQLHCGTRRILVPQPGIKPMPPALGAQSLNHWIAREVPVTYPF